MNTQLPEHLARVTIKDMVVGEKAYTVSWAIQVDQHGQCWIRGDYAFTYRPLGTSKMHIERTGQGFKVQVCPDEQYEQYPIPFPSSAERELLPVVKIS